MKHPLVKAMVGDGKEKYDEHWSTDAILSGGKGINSGAYCNSGSWIQNCAHSLISRNLAQKSVFKTLLIEARATWLESRTRAER